MAGMAFAFLPSVQPPLDLVFFLVLLATAAGAVGFLAETYMARSHLAPGDLSHRGGSRGDDRIFLWPTQYLARFRIGM